MSSRQRIPPSASPRFDLTAIGDLSIILRALDAATTDPELHRRFAATVAADPRLFGERSWVAGGCFLIAESLRHLFGGRLLAIGEANPLGDAAIEHVLLETQLEGERLLIDIHGFYVAEEELFAFLTEVGNFREPQVVEADRQALEAALLFDAPLAAALTERLAAFIEAERPKEGSTGAAAD